jgi:hypothetical protein
MLKVALPASAKNGVRKLFQENRQSFIEALMHRSVRDGIRHCANS